MRKGRWSLKFKAGLYVGFFTIFFIITLMVAVGFGFDRYYYSMKKEAMVEASQKISNIYRKEGGSDESSLDDLSQQYALDVLIVDQGKLVYSSRPGRRVHLPMEKDMKDEEVIVQGKENEAAADKPAFRLPLHIAELRDLLDGKQPEEEILGKVQLYKDMPDFEHFNLIDRIQDGTYVIISQSVAPMRESIYIVQRFIIVCGLIWLVLAIIGTILLTQRMTQPLLELKNLAVAMAHLDFSKRWKGNFNDEIGELGDSINTLANQLNVALTALQQSNTELQKQLDKAKEVEHMRKSFLSAVSHELKTPLAIIQAMPKGWTRWISTRKGSSATVPSSAVKPRRWINSSRTCSTCRVWKRALSNWNRRSLISRPCPKKARPALPRLWLISISWPSGNCQLK